MSGASGQIVHRVVPVGVYVAVFIALLLLTGATVWVARYDLGAWSFLHTPVALAIASLKALLVVLFFMHVRDSERLVWAIIAAGLLWLALLIFLTMGDYVSRESVVLPLSMSTMMPAGQDGVFNRRRPAGGRPRAASLVPQRPIESRPPLQQILHGPRRVCRCAAPQPVARQR